MYFVALGQKHWALDPIVGFGVALDFNAVSTAPYFAVLPNKTNGRSMHGQIAGELPSKMDRRPDR